MNQENTRKLWLYNLIADNMPLPKGTRINTTDGGVPTGGNHELSDNLLKAANKVPNHLSYYVPFWILGWRDLHDDLLPPMEADVPEEEVLHQTAPGAKIIRHESAAMICPKCGVNKESTLASIKRLLKERDDLSKRVEQLEADNKQMRRALEILREALSTATNSNIVDYIDAVVAFNEGDPQLYRGASAGMISWALRRPRRPT